MLQSGYSSMGGDSSLVPVAASSGRSDSFRFRYFSLLRSNAHFRRLWLAQLISELGDWFYSLAVYDLLLNQTHSGQAVGWAIIIQTLPWFLMTPLAGLLVDRFSRRRLMILADVVRGLIVLGMLLAAVASNVTLIYLLLGLEVVFASIFEPAHAAILPKIVTADEILPANALSSGTWAVALAVGAALGGAVTALLGRDVAFAANSVSFFVSAAFLIRIHVREEHVEASHRRTTGPAEGNGSLREGLEYLRTNGKVLTLVFAKTGVGILGGALLLLVIFGERIFPVAGHGALAVGLLYSARGVGAAAGPIIGDRLAGGLENRMWKSISISFFVIAAAYLAFSQAPNLPVAALCVFIGHMGGSNIWVMSTSLIQIHTSDRFCGRVFAVDYGLLMLMIAASNYFIGCGLDHWGLTARQLAAGLGAVMVVPGILWLIAPRVWAESKT